MLAPPKCGERGAADDACEGEEAEREKHTKINGQRDSHLKYGEHCGCKD